MHHDPPTPRPQNPDTRSTEAVPAHLVARKDPSAALDAVQEYAEAIVQTMPDAPLVLDTDLRVKFTNDAFYAAFQVRPHETLDTLVYELGNGQWNIAELRLLLEDILPQNKVSIGYEIDHEFEEIGRRVMLLNGRRLDHQEFSRAIMNTGMCAVRWRPAPRDTC